MTAPWECDQRRRDRETGWLDVLIEAFEEAEMLHQLPCDERLLSMVRARLEAPSVLRARKLLESYHANKWDPGTLFPGDQ